MHKIIVRFSIFSIFFFPCLFSTDTQAKGCNHLQLNNLPATSVSFNSNANPTLALTVQRSGNNDCDYFLGISKGGAADFASRRIANAANTIPMQLYKDAAHTASMVLQDAPSANNSNQVITGSFPDAHIPSTNTHNYYAALGGLDYQRFGSYQDVFTITLYEGTVGGTYTTKNSKTITFTYSMARQIDLSLVDSGAPFNINDTTQTVAFGILSPSASRTFDLILKYNAGYNIFFSSQNNGVLKHSSVNDTVPYAISVGGIPANLGNSSALPVSVATGTGVSPVAGTVFHTTITIGSIGTARAGNYSDAITITVQSNE